MMHIRRKEVKHAANGRRGAAGVRALTRRLFDGTLDLGADRRVTALRLLVDQDPAGFTRHVVLAGREPSPTTEVAELAGDTRHGQLLEVDLDVRARYLRVETLESPSWVGWLEIEVLSDP